MDRCLPGLREISTILGFLVVFACSNDNTPANFETEELQRLLASDSAKVWQRLSRKEDGTNKTLADCETDNRLIFSFPKSAEDTITINYETGPSFCPGQSDSLIFQGAWDLLSADNPLVYDSLRIAINGDTSLRNIDFITSQMLMLSFEEDVSSQILKVVESYEFVE